ncbi:MAG: TIGR03557 family F420-dependent LLM class oxidoreductase [Candidatus Limnocylindria bacterium]
MLTLGWKASAEQFGPSDLLELGVAAEEAGFGSIVVSDHFHPWRDTDGHAPFSFAWLAAIGQRTRRARLGTSVVSPGFRYHPAIVAQAVATLAVLTPGRVFLGVGSGEAMNEVPVTVAEWPATRERQHRLREAVVLIRKLWSEDYVTHRGDHFQTREAKIFDKPTEHVPILVAAGGPKAAQMAGEIGDGIIVTSGKKPELYRDDLIPGLERGAAKAGKDTARLERMIEMKVSYDTDRDRALADTREWAALALPEEAKTGVDDPREMERRSAEAAGNAHTRFIVSSDPDEVVDRVRPYLDLGFTHLVFHLPGRDQRRSIELVGRDLLPRLRALAPARA